MKRLVVSLGISGMGLFLSGCARPDTDVTSSASYNFSSFAGTAWKTKVKTALAEIGQGMPRYKLHLVAPIVLIRLTQNTTQYTRWASLRNFPPALGYVPND
jgi:hypothetical protein